MCFEQLLIVFIIERWESASILLYDLGCCEVAGEDGVVQIFLGEGRMGALGFFP